MTEIYWEEGETRAKVVTLFTIEVGKKEQYFRTS